MCKQSSRILSILLVIIMIINMLPSQALALDEKQSTYNDATLQDSSSVDGLHVVEELVDRRSEYTKEFRLSNGFRVASVYGYPVHYEENGEWREIDNTLKLSGTRSGNSYTNTAGIWDVSFPQSLGMDKYISITKDGHTLSFRMDGAVHENQDEPQLGTSEATEAPSVPDVPAISPQTENFDETKSTEPTETANVEETDRKVFTLVAPNESVDATVETLNLQSLRSVEEYPEMVLDKIGSRLRYANIYTETDLLFDVSSNMVKESIVLKDYSDSLVGYTFALNTGAMIPVLQESGAIELLDPESRELVMFMPAPYLIDAAGEICYDVEVFLDGKDGTYVLSYLLPNEWLAADARRWPVLLDPTVLPDMTISNIKDSTVGSGGYANYASEYLYCGYYAGNTNFLKSWIFLKYGVIPELTTSDVIVDARVRLNAVSGNYNSEKPLPAVEVHKVLGAWETKTINWSNKPDVEAKVLDYDLVYPNTGHHYWSVTDIVREWYETGVNTGMMFKIPDEIEAQENLYHKFCSSEHSSYYYYTRPYLTITYRNSNGLESYWNYSSASAGRAGTGYVNQNTGKLVWLRDDIGFGGNRMPVSISHAYNSNNHMDNSYGMGYGWKTNFNQSVYHWSPAGTGVGYIVWEDGDGTTHYFFKIATGKYMDEDGLELIATNTGSGTKKYAITDKQGNCSYFDTKGRLTEQTNNQKKKSSITITYTSADSSLISTITDGAGRKYTFTYGEHNLLSKISYTGSGAEEISFVEFVYDGNQNLTTVTDKDGLSSTYTYTDNHLLASGQDIDGYKLSYTYTTTMAGLPNRIASVTEHDDTTEGMTLGFEYARNQTKLTENPDDTSTTVKNVQVIQFNDMGNVVSVQDGEGRAHFAQYSIDKPKTEEEEEESTRAATSSDTSKANQLKLSSKLQNTVANVLMNSSFEGTAMWTTHGSGITQTIDSTAAYLGSNSLKVVNSSTTAAAGVSSEAFTIENNTTYTFSAYVKGTAEGAYLAIKDGNTEVSQSEELDVTGEWKRLEVSYTNNSGSAKSVTAHLITPKVTPNVTPNVTTVNMDCVQIEKAPTASRYNLLQDGDFAQEDSAWSSSTGWTTATKKVPAIQLDANVYKMIGDMGNKKRISQTVNVSGEKGDTFVLAGWAKADSVPIKDDTEREFGLIATFKNGDTVVNTEIVRFNAAVDTTIEWQYAAEPILANGTYTSVLVEVAYDYNANTAYFDGIQLFKEEFGQSYTYDENGNVISVKDVQGQMTEYEYTNNDLTKEILPTGAKLTYTYDKYHNVKTATSDSGIKYSFEYDDYGNNTKVSITSDGVTLTSSALYTIDGNYMVSTTDAVGNATVYSYDTNTGVLNHVIYPDDIPNSSFFGRSDLVIDGTITNMNTDARKTVYTYDDMYRLATATQAIDEDTTLTASYEYTNDLLTEIATNSTTYLFGYGDFALRSDIKVGTNTLATYKYTPDHILSKLIYGTDSDLNADYVEYEYDDYDRLILQTYEDEATVAYQYDNNGALATVADSATGIKTTYFYDFTDRLMRYAEKATGFSHIVGYEYDLINNLTALIESINGIKYATAYAYDKDNRVTSIAGGISTTGDDGSLAINNATIKDYTYDGFGRVSQQVTNKYNGAYTPPQPPEPTETTEPTEATEPTEPAPDSNKAAVKTDTFQFTTPTGLSTESTPRTSSQISSHTIDAAGYDKTFSYIYDANGNILEISDGTNVIKYTYDKANQLIREDNQAADYIHIWTYDDAGNILSRTEYSYTTEALGTATDTFSYVYTDSNWGDLLTSYNRQTITHDNIGNPLSDGRRTYTWKHGRQLATLTQGGTTWSFTYNADGIRTQRTDCPTCGSCPTRDDGLSCADDLTCAECTTCTNDATTYNYVYNGSSLSQLTIFKRSDGTTVTTTLNFVYDASGAPMAVIYNGTTYYYVTNMQGDVIAILDGSGNAVVEYMYDAWGKLLTTTGSMADSLGLHNPLRYRGYVYDHETALYYLQSRYYDPEISRFINADNISYLGSDGTVTSYNLFSYCKNNPILYLDKLGTSPMVPPMIENGLNLPASGGLPVVINGTTYYYAISYNSSGQLYEYWFDADGNLVRARHHSTHGNEKEHKNPHDHEGTKGKNDKNSIKKERLPVDEHYKSPLESAGTRSGCNMEVVGNAAAGIILGAAIYQIVKWGIASALAPATSGFSYLIASVA